MNAILFVFSFFNGASPASATVTPVDTFTDTGGVLLPSHSPTPTANFAWQAISGLGGSNDLRISDANRVRPNATGEVICYADATPASADYSAMATIYIKSVGGGFVGLGVRQDSASKILYTAIYNVSALRWELYWVNGGSFSLLGTSSQTLSVETGYHLELAVSGTSLTVKVDGSTIITATDSAISSAGFRSIYASGAASDSTGLHVDNFGQAYSPSVSGKFPWLLLVSGRAA